MKLNTTEEQILSGGVIDDAEFRLHEDSHIHVMRILQSQIYTNKPLAVLREYS